MHCISAAESMSSVGLYYNISNAYCAAVYLLFFISYDKGAI